MKDAPPQARLFYCGPHADMRQNQEFITKTGKHDLLTAHGKIAALASMDRKSLIVKPLPAFLKCRLAG
jgi:hypothetical protein